MKSFGQYVEKNELRRVATEAFTLMVQRGIDPLLFLDWYVKEGQHLENGFLMREAFFQGVKNWWNTKMSPQDSGKVKAALNALQVLQHKNWIVQDSPQLQHSLEQAVKMLQDPKVINTPQTQGERMTGDQFQASMTGQQPQAAPTATTQAAPSQPVHGGTKGNCPPGTQFNPTNGLCESTIALKAITEMARRGIDPREFVKWYTREGFLYENNQLFEDRLGDWFGAMWSGAGSWLGGQGFKTGYGAKYDQIKKKAAWDAMNAINELPDHVKQNLGNHLNVLLQNLEPMANPKQGEEKKDQGQPDQQAQQGQEVPDGMDPDLWQAGSNVQGQQYFNPNVNAKLVGGIRQAVDNKAITASGFDPSKLQNDPANPLDPRVEQILKTMNPGMLAKIADVHQKAKADPSQDHQAHNIISGLIQQATGAMDAQGQPTQKPSIDLAWKFVPKREKVFQEWHYLAGIKCKTSKTS